MTTSELSVAVEQWVATVEIHRPPNNFFDGQLIESLAKVYEKLDEDAACRVIVLCSEGKHFCAGADFASKREAPGLQREKTQALYRNAVRLFRTSKPIVAAIQGAAVGGGLGLALSADFRVACVDSRFCANFSRLGFHQGFGISVTLPRLIGHSQADLMLYTGKRVKGEEAAAMGLADELVEREDVRARCFDLASEIAASAPLAVRSIRKTRRAGLADEVATMTEHELAEQTCLQGTEDFQEGIRAMSERRAPVFNGR
jgi:enoyl-CoA hydratase/carnithine racemase